jgi:hypothetical protein
MATSKGTSRSKKVEEVVEEVEVVEAAAPEAPKVNEELKAERDAAFVAPAADKGDEPSAGEAKIMDALEKDPSLVGRLKDLLGIGDATEVVDDMGTTLTAADVSSQHQINVTLMQNYTRESAAKAFDVDPKEVASFSVRGGVPDEYGQLTSDEIFLIIVTRDATKHAKKIQA